MDDCSPKETETKRISYTETLYFCKGGWCDVKGDHAIMCGGGASRNLRHNNVHNIIAKAARDVGFKTGLEHGGGLGDKRRPGDVVVYIFGVMGAIC